MTYDGYDDDDDPVQFSLSGIDEDSDGLTSMNGPCLGVVLSVNYSNSQENLLYRFLLGDTTNAQQGSYLEASVVLLYGGTEMFVELDHVVVLQGKCSNQGPGEGEPSDWTEDVPNGCTAKELDEFYSSAANAPIESLSGDWVVVDFIGGILQVPVITKWFPSPLNKADAATKDIGKRFLLRRNNSELQIDKNGDLHLTHRVGQYIQLKGENIVIKHRKGQIVNLDEEGSITLTDKNGNLFLLDEDGVSINNGQAYLTLDGDQARLTAGSGDIVLQADQIDLMGSEINAYGNAGARSLANEDLINLTSALTDNVDAMNDALLEFMGTLAGFAIPPGPLVPLAAPAAKAATALGLVKVALVEIKAAYVEDLANQTLRTTVFKGE